MTTTFRWRAAASSAALVVWLAGTMAPAAESEAEALSTSFRKAARRVLPAVVTVRPIGADPFEGSPPNRLFGPGPRGFLPELVPQQSGGSGVVIDAGKGYVLTNDHVVQGASRVVVILHDGRERTAAQVRRDPKSDLALLVIDGKGLSGAEWGDSDGLDTGDWVLAIGQPFGLSDTVTAGIVSGKRRGIGVAMYEDLIQTDAAINPGNSGGPLVNLRGEVVGINTAIKTMRGGYEGVGFAIPATRARRVAADLAEHGHVRRAYLGIQIGPIDRDAAERLDQPGSVAVTGVGPDSPASEAGLRRGDVILEIEGKPVAGPGALQAAIEFAPVGQPVRLTIDRDGERREVQIVPKEQPETFGLPGSEPPLRPGPPRELPPLGPGGLPGPEEPRETALRTTDVPFPELGLRLSEPTPELSRRYRMNRAVHGLVIVGVDDGGPADTGGLEPGMVITNVGDRQVESLADFRAALARRADETNLVIRVLKGTKAEFRVIPRRGRAPTGGEPARRPESAPPGLP